MAELNADSNKSIHSTSALTYQEPPKTNHTHPREFLKPQIDEDVPSGSRATVSFEPPFTRASQRFSSSTKTQPSTFGRPSLSLSPAEMDRRLRQNKPRLLLMGQRRCVSGALS